MDSETEQTDFSSDEEERLPFENTDQDFEETSSFSSVKIATTNCLHAYAIERMKGAENYSIPWPPLMLKVLHHLKKRELITERNLAMLELLLKVPIQLKIKHMNGEIDLNDDRSIDFGGMSFVESIELLKDLLRDGIITPENMRLSLPTTF